MNQPTRTLDVLTFEGGRIVHRAKVKVSEAVRSRVLPDLQFRLDDVAG